MVLGGAHLVYVDVVVVVPVVDGLEEAFQLPHRPAVHHQDVGHPDRRLRPRHLVTQRLVSLERPGRPD